MTPTIDLEGLRFGRLTAVEFAGRLGRNSAWRCACDCGVEKLVRRDHLVSGAVRSCGCLHRESSRQRRLGKRGWLKDRPSYHGAHARVRLRRGSASDHRCACGAPADEWAYDHADPAAVTGEVVRDGRTMVLTYSLDPAHYQPMCIPCHRAFDREVSR